ncbi:MAG: hypothetical protein R3B13_27120 [Polyangiaceae bacterium]
MRNDWAMQGMAIRARDTLSEFARELGGDELLLLAWAEYDAPGADVRRRPDFAVFSCWSLYHWRFDGQRTLAQAWLETCDGLTDPALRAFVLSASQTSFSFHEVLARASGNWMLLRDLATGKETIVADLSVTGDPVRHVLFGKVVRSSNSSDVAVSAILEPVHDFVHRADSRDSLAELALRARSSSVLAAYGCADTYLTRMHFRIVCNTRDPERELGPNSDGVTHLATHYFLHGEFDDVCRRLLRAGLRELLVEGREDRRQFVFADELPARHRLQKPPVPEVTVLDYKVLLETHGTAEHARCRDVVERACPFRVMATVITVATRGNQYLAQYPGSPEFTPFVPKTAPAQLPQGVAPRPMGR